MSKRNAVLQLKKTIEEQGQVHLLRIIRKHLSENPRTDDKLPTFRSLMRKKWQSLQASQKEVGYLETLREKKEALVSDLFQKYLKVKLPTDLTVNKAFLFEKFILFSGMQWGVLLPPRNLKFQHHKLDQHFIRLRRVPIFFTEVSCEWWKTILEQTLRRPMPETEKEFLTSLYQTLLNFEKGLETGMDLHTLGQQFFSLKLEVATAKDFTLALDPFSFQMLERFFASLLNPARESE